MGLWAVLHTPTGGGFRCSGFTSLSSRPPSYSETDSSQTSSRSLLICFIFKGIGRCFYCGGCLTYAPPPLDKERNTARRTAKQVRNGPVCLPFIRPERDKEGEREGTVRSSANASPGYKSGHDRALPSSNLNASLSTRPPPPRRKRRCGDAGAS